jgi:hypothetical protein
MRKLTSHEADDGTMRVRAEYDGALTRRASPHSASRVAASWLAAELGG